MNNVNQVLQEIDWALLAEQKAELIKAETLNPAFAGILNLIDGLQDAAEKDGFPVVWLEANEEDPFYSKAAGAWIDLKETK